MISSDMSEYFSDKDRIKLLEAKLISCTDRCCKWERRYRDIKGTQTARQIRTSKINALVQSYVDGDKSLSLKSIAKKCFLSIKTIHNLSCKLRNKNDSLVRGDL